MPIGAKHRSTCLRHSATDDSSSLHRRIRVQGRHVGSLGQRGGLLYAFPMFKMVPQVLQRSIPRCSDDSDCSSAGNSFLVPGTSATVPRRFHPIVCRRSTTADSGRRPVRRGDRLVTTGRQIFTHGDFAGHISGEGPFPGSCSHDVKGPSRMCMNLTGRDSFPSVGRKDGMCSESEAIISVLI